MSRHADRAGLRALDVPGHQLVELRVLFPRALLASTGGAKSRAGNGLALTVREIRQDVAAVERDRDRVRSAVDNIGRTALILLALGLGPALEAAMFVYAAYGRELRVPYDREYEQEPPSDLPPALVAPLLRQSRSSARRQLALVPGPQPSVPGVTLTGSWRKRRT